ncbi:MAG: hypothetical protein HYV03_03850 [Deltaproteobacteria bacterium]|nr:hypothetical protein [Deltaproteobacteria bacterium]
MVAVTLGILLTGIAVTSVRARFEAQARRTANHLTATFRYLYTRAATEARTYRLAIDLEKQTYWIERGSGTALIETAPASAPPSRLTNQADEGESYDRAPAEGAFGPAPNLPRALAQPGVMPSKVRFQEIYTSAGPEPVTTGMAYIHFFPQGYAEPAIVNLTDLEGTRFIALEVNPLTGFTRVYREHRGRK